LLQGRHHGRRAVRSPWRLTQNRAWFSRQWTQSWTVRGSQRRKLELVAEAARHIW
jgi:hypothetical protein